MAQTIQSRRLRSSELARIAGVSTDTLRHYERLGVLAKPYRLASGYREYPVEAVNRVKVIRRALMLGFSLKELARLFRVRDSGGVPCREVRAMAAEKLGAVDQRISELIQLRDHMKELLQRWDTKLAGTPGNARAYLLDGLASAPSPIGENHEEHDNRNSPARFAERIRANRRSS